MPKQVRIRRGTTAQHATFVGAEFARARSWSPACRCSLKTPRGGAIRNASWVGTLVCLRARTMAAQKCYLDIGPLRSSEHVP